MEHITYTAVGNYLLPNIVLREPPPEMVKPLGRYASIRQRYLKEHRPALYSKLLLSETLYPHLWEIDEAAAHRVAVIADRAQAEKLINELVFE